MVRQFHSWRQRVFPWIIIAGILFVVLTCLAMLFYPGYSFSHNFFSELGLIESRSGQPNTLSAVLFVTAMTLAGSSLALFFLAFPQFFTGSLSGKLLSGLGSTLGVLSGLCFIGVGFTPADLFLDAHVFFVLWAFRLFPLAIIPYIVVILGAKRYPNRYALVFVGFAILLFLYLALMTRGPSPDTTGGRMIQVIGQKAIGYASVVSIAIQAQGARKIVGAQKGFKT
jgi:hypothetical membrane protein